MSHDVHFPFKYRPGKHEGGVIQYFSDMPDGELFQRPHKPLATEKNVIMCFTNRCGSNWLAEALHATGLMGLADEFFNEKRIKRVSENQGFKSFDAFIHHLPTVKHQQRPCFATKISWDQLCFLTKYRAIPEIITDPHYIYVLRKDIAAQALSFLLAAKTGQWKSYYNSGVDGKADPFDVSDQDILKMINRLIRNHEYFLRYFACFGVQPHVVFYEDLMQDLHGEVDKLLVGLGLAESGKWAFDEEKIRVSKQATDKNAERLAQFHHSMSQMSKK